MSEREQRGGAVGRLFWIQGRTGVYWQNLEDHEDGQVAIARLGALVGDDRYDELRLIQAEISSITGATDYLHIVTVRDGQVLSPNGDEFAARAAYEEQEPPPERMPQLLLWPEHEEDEADQQHALPLEEAEPDAPAPQRGPPMPGSAGVQERRLEDGSWDVGGWRISDATHAAVEAAEQEATRRKAARAEGTRQRSAEAGLSIDAEDAAVFGRRMRDGGRADRSARPRGLAPGRLIRRALSRARPASSEARPDRRVALMSGVFAGAIATGLALAAMAPDRAADIYAAALRDLSVLAPDLSLEEALAAGDVAQLHRKLAAGADPNARDAEGTPLLLRAARGGNLQAVTLLLQAGADPTRPANPDGRSILHRTAAEGLSLALARMLDAGAPVDLAGGTYGCLTPLSAAAAAGKARAASILAERGASLEPQPRCEVGPMQIAIAHPHLLGRLEAIRAEREGWIRMATGPRPPLAEPATAGAAPVAETTATPADDPAPEPPGPAPIANNDLVEDEAPAPQLALATPPEAPPATPKPAVDPEPAKAPAAETPAAETPSAEAQAPAAPASTLEEQDPEAPLETVEVAGLPVTPAPPPTAETPSETAGTARRDLPQPRLKPEPPPAKPAAEAAAETPTAEPRPTKRPPDAEAQAAAIATAIDKGDVARVRSLTDGLAPERLAAMTTVADDRYGSGERHLVDHAVLRGRRRIADLLIDKGLMPSPTAMHAAIANADRPELAGTVAWLIDRGVDLDAREEGLTPLMRAALRGRGDLVEQLLLAGANPSLSTEDGRTAADLARRAGRPALQETLLLAAQESRYRALMLGLSWTDTLESLEDRIERCKDIGDDFTACKLKADAWLDDAAVVVGQFDRRAGDRLVALQIDSRPIADPMAARRRFEEVAAAIEDRLPSDHGGFTNRRAPADQSFFHALRPEVNQGAYFGYWPDHDRARPVFVHLKLSGIDDARGFYRIVIGNPFRAS